MTILAWEFWLFSGCHSYLTYAYCAETTGEPFRAWLEAWFAKRRART